MVGLKNKIESEEFHQTFRKLVDDITTILRDEKDVPISDSFVVMMVKIASLDPENKFLIKQPIIRSELERMQKVVIERILGMPLICRNIIRLQLHYRGNHFTRDEVVNAHREELEETYADLLADMISNVPKRRRHYDFYYQKLVAAVIMRADMGDSSDYVIVQETESSLGSVFPKDDINLLNSMTAADRETELRHLMKMTAGIRLFTRYKDPARGIGIPDLPTILAEKIKACVTALNEIRERNVQRIIKYTTVIRPYFLVDTPLINKQGRRDISQEMVWIRQGLTMVHQVLLYLKEISDEISDENNLVNDLIHRYEASLADLRKTIIEQDSVATFIVYPKFVELADSWERLQESVDYIETCSELVEALHEFSENDLKEIDPVVGEILGPKFHMKEEKFFKFPAFDMPVDEYALAQITPFTADLDPLTTEYSGFCVWSLVKGLGLILLSNPNIGVFHWHGLQYLFSTPDAAVEFRRNPDMYIYKAIQIARRWPELIFLLKLDLASFNPDYTTAADKASSPVRPLISREIGIQTELHPYETNIVREYTWNEWELRRQALILSKIYKCATHSTQTHEQALKKTEGIQTYSLKNARAQTDTSVYVEAPRNQFWFYGLRGYHCCVPPHILELSRESPMEMKGKVSNVYTQVEATPPSR